MNHSLRTSSVITLDPVEGAEDFTGHGEVLAVDGTHKFRTQDGHVLRITGTDEEVTFVCTSTTANTDVHEYFQ